MKIIELKISQSEEAFELFKALYNCQCELVPALDEENARMDKILPMLEWCLKDHQGVAALENNKMVGYMTGFYIDEFLGTHKGVYCPEWAHGSVDGGAFEIYRQMYRRLGQIWVEDGCLTHAANTMNFARDAQEAFFWNGFGSICIDAIREVRPVNKVKKDGLCIKPVGENDVPAWLSMVEEHNFHIAEAPAFKPYLHGERKNAQELAEWLGQPGNHAWIGMVGEKPAGYMQITSVEDGAAWMVGGSLKFAVNGAFVYPEYRANGIASALLDGIMEWAGKQGLMRCSVDFEATNIEACNFWLRYFQPVCRSVVRRLDERILHTLRSNS